MFREDTRFVDANAGSTAGNSGGGVGGGNFFGRSGTTPLASVPSASTFAGGSSGSSNLQQQQNPIFSGKAQHRHAHPLRILLVRHGLAESNVDKSVYSKLSDNAVPLHDVGRKQALVTGRFIHRYFRETFGDRDAAAHHFRILVSPFLRTRQTAECILLGMREAQLEEASQLQEGGEGEKQKPKESSFSTAAAAARTTTTSPPSSAVTASVAGLNYSETSNTFESPKQPQQQEQQQQQEEEEQKEEGEQEQQKEKNLDLLLSPQSLDNKMAKLRFWIDSIREDHGLTEQNFGAMEGTGENMEKYEQELQRMKRSRQFLGSFFATPPGGGESAAQVTLRVNSVISSIVASAQTGSTTSSRREAVRTVILVSHGITSRCFLSNWLHRSPESSIDLERNAPNCSVRLLTGSNDNGYIFGGWCDLPEFEKFPNGVPLERLNQLNEQIPRDPIQSTWQNILQRVRETGSPAELHKQEEEQEQQVVVVKKGMEEGEEEGDVNDSQNNSSTNLNSSCPASSPMLEKGNYRDFLLREKNSWFFDESKF